MIDKYPPRSEQDLSIVTERDGSRSKWGAFPGWSLCRVVLSCVVFTLASGCITETVWDWAGKSRYTVIPSRITSLGLLRETGEPDRLFFKVGAMYRGEKGTREGGEVYVLVVPPDWKDRPKLEFSGGLQLDDLVEAAPSGAMPLGSTLESVPILPHERERDLPGLDQAPYVFVEGPPGLLYIYGVDDELQRWVRLAANFTGTPSTTPPSPFNYVMAAMATPVTALLDAVGVVFYVILWPVWSKAGIGYGDDEGYEREGKKRRETRPPAQDASP